MARTISSCLGLVTAAAAATAVAAGMSAEFAPETLTAAVALGGAAGSTVGSVGGNLLTDMFKVLHRPAAERWLEGRSAVDENSRVESPLRLAHLKALGVVLKRFDTTWPEMPQGDDRRSAERFSQDLHDFLSPERDTAKRAAFLTDATLPADEQRVRQAVLDALPDAFDISLAARRDAGETAAIVQSFNELRAALEKAILAEIRLRTATLDEALPTAFTRSFDGAGFPDSWFDLFVRDAAFRLTQETGFAPVWQAEQLSLVRAITEAHTATLAEIKGVQAEPTAMLQELLAYARSSGATQRAADQGIPEPAVRAIVLRLGGEGIARDDLIPWLDNWIAAAREELGRHSNEGDAFEAARKEAERRFRAGRIKDASAAFMDVFVREERQEAERQAERKHHRVWLLEEAIRFDELAFDAPAAVKKLRLMATIEGVGGADAVGAWLIEKADNFYERGRDKGANAALAIAIAAYRAALAEQTRERVPLDWAMTQNNLGNALQTLGARESGTARLAEAIAAYRAALEERKRERVPLDWAMTQDNLGTALATLGERDSGTARLEEAIAAYRAALEERTRERVPLDWATTQNNLGTALWTLGEREIGTARLEDAVAADLAALEERTRERVPLDWAATQNNLGNALATLGERESGTARLEEAVAAYRAALEEMTRERVPLDWAATQNNLGTALWTLGERESRTARLEEAVAAYRAALEEWTRERVPLDCAMTQNNLGDALATLGERESGTERLEEAVAAWDQSLTVLATAWPSEWVEPIRTKRESALAEIARRATPPA